MMDVYRKIDYAIEMGVRKGKASADLNASGAEKREAEDLTYIFTQVNPRSINKRK